VPIANSSTSVDESKNPPPVGSPPIAYNLPVLGSYAKPMSARCMVQVGPVEKAMLAKSSRMLVVLLASGAAICRPTFFTELSGNAFHWPEDPNGVLP
jgi:hypothetical protein